MAQPSIASVSIGDTQFNAIGIHFGMGTVNDGVGMPMTGALNCAIAVVVNLNDRLNVPFSTLSTLFNLAYIVNRTKIQPIKLIFWADDARQDVVCTYSFRGWISNYVTATGTSRGADGGDSTNHILTLTLQPELDPQQFVRIDLGN